MLMEWGIKCELILGKSDVRLGRSAEQNEYLEQRATYTADKQKLLDEQYVALLHAYAMGGATPGARRRH